MTTKRSDEHRSTTGTFAWRARTAGALAAAVLILVPGPAGVRAAPQSQATVVEARITSRTQRGALVVIEFAVPPSAIYRTFTAALEVTEPGGRTFTASSVTGSLADLAPGTTGTLEWDFGKDTSTLQVAQVTLRVLLTGQPRTTQPPPAAPGPGTSSGGGGVNPLVWIGVAAGGGAAALLALKGGSSGSDSQPAPQPRPVASITAVNTGNQTPLAAVTSVQFTGSATSSGSSLTYSWSFGDGTQASGASVTHIFGSAGNFNVTLTVSDSNGTSNPAATTVQVGSLTGIWTNTFQGDTRTFTLTQTGTTLTGTYQNTALGSTALNLFNSFVTPQRGFTIQASGSGDLFVVSGGQGSISADLNAFSGLVEPPSAAQGNVLTWRRQ